MNVDDVWLDDHEVDASSPPLRHRTHHEELAGLRGLYPDADCWTTIHVHDPCGPDCQLFEPE